MTELSAGYHAAAANLAQTGTMTERVYDGMTGAGQAEREIAAVVIENDANVAYALRVGTTTAYVLGDALYASRIGSFIVVGDKRFFSKSGADAGKLYAISTCADLRTGPSNLGVHGPNLPAALHRDLRHRGDGTAGRCDRRRERHRSPRHRRRLVSDQVGRQHVGQPGPV